MGKNVSLRYGVFVRSSMVRMQSAVLLLLWGATVLVHAAPTEGSGDLTGLVLETNAPDASSSGLDSATGSEPADPPEEPKYIKKWSRLCSGFQDVQSSEAMVAIGCA